MSLLALCSDFLIVASAGKNQCIHVLLRCQIVLDINCNIEAYTCSSIVCTAADNATDLHMSAGSLVDQINKQQFFSLYDVSDCLFIVF